MSAGTSREAFEAAHSHLSTASLRRNGGSTGCYTSATTAMSWAMWQASRKQALDEAIQAAQPEDAYQDGWFDAKADSVRKIEALK